MINLVSVHSGFDHLFSSGVINGLRLSNRVIMPAMATNYAADSGAITERFVDYYVARAHPVGDVVDPGKIYRGNIPGCLRL